VRSCCASGGGPPRRSSVAFEIPEGFEAIAVEVGIPPGVAGYIRGGDRVSLIATVEAPGDDHTTTDGTVTEEPGEIRSQYLLQGIEVLAVGQRTTETEGEQAPQSSVLMTVALEPEDAERLVFAIENASLYFTLLPEDAEPQTRRAARSTTCSADAGGTGTT
jgi:pilus assembly protein CpaB